CAAVFAPSLHSRACVGLPSLCPVHRPPGAGVLLSCLDDGACLCRIYHGGAGFEALPHDSAAQCGSGGRTASVGGHRDSALLAIFGSTSDLSVRLANGDGPRIFGRPDRLSVCPPAEPRVRSSSEPIREPVLC